MKNLTKVLAVVLALCMGLSMVSTAAFTDVADDASYSEAVSILSALGILNGYEDGSFGPDKTITRAEFSAVVCRALGLGEAAAGTTIFSDVNGHWASGYIALVQQQGIVNGYPDGTFQPDSPVKYEEAIKMLVVALGYDPTIAKVDALGNPVAYYPGAYIVVASQKGLTANIANAKVGENASRAVVAQMVYNALPVPLMVQTGFGTNTTFGTGSELLLNKLGVTKFEGSVYATSASDKAVKEGTVKLDVAAQITADLDSTSATSFVKAKPGDKYEANPYIEQFDGESADSIFVAKYAEELDETVKALLDNAIVAYVLNADTDEAELLAIAKRGTRNEEVEFMSEDIKKFAADRSEVSVYTSQDAEDDVDYKLNVTKVYVNGTEYTADDDIEDQLDEYFDEEKTADIRLLRNKTGDEYNVVYITNYIDLIVDSVNAKNYKVYTNGETLELDEEDDDLRFTIYKDGEVASFEDIKENDVLSVAKNADGEIVTVIITSEQVSGKVETFDNEDKLVTIAGEEYRYAGIDFGTANTSEVKIGDQATFYVNARGVLVGVDVDNTVSNLSFGFATVLGRTSGYGATWKLVLCDTEGAWQTLDLNSTVSFEGAKAIKVSDLADADDMIAKVAERAKKDDDTVLLNKVIAYEVNASGNVSKIYTNAVSDDEAAFRAKTDASAAYNASVSTLGIFDLTDNVVIYSVEEGFDLAAREVEADDLFIGSAASLVDRTDYPDVIGYNEKDGVPAVIFGAGMIGAVDFASDFFVVASKTTKENADGDLGVELKGFVAGEEATVFVAEDAAVYAIDYAKVEDADVAVDPTTVVALDDGESVVDYSDIAKGDILVMSQAANGEAAKVYIIASAEDLYDDDDNAFVYDAYGTASKLITFEQGDEEYSFQLVYAAERDGTRLAIAEDLTLADDDDDDMIDKADTKLAIGGAKGATFTKNGKSDKVVASSYGDINPGKRVDEKGGDLVFVRVYGANKVEEFVNFVAYDAE